MDNGIAQPDEMLELFADDVHVRFRLALLRDGQNWKVHTLFIEHGLDKQERGPQSFVFDYGDVYLASGNIEGRVAKQWLHLREGEITPPGKTGPVRRFALPPFGGPVYWTRHPSHSLTDLHSVPRPLTSYDYSGQVWTNLHLPQGFLVADGCPFFPDVQTALYRLIYQADEEEMSSGLGPGQRIALQVGHNIGWLENIHLSPLAINVRVSGTSVAGMQLTIGGAGNVYQQQQLVARATVTVPLSDGIPSQLYIVLSRGHDWVDYYARDARWVGYRRKQPENVTIEFGDKITEYDALISEGEGQNIEFKGRLSGDGDRFLRTISAFANGVGGTIFLGIENETAATLGIDTSITQQADRVSRLIRDNLTPNPDYTIDSFKRDGKNVVVVRIQPGRSDIYGVHPSDPHYFVRRGATNFPAKPEELREIVLVRQSVRTDLPY